MEIGVFSYPLFSLLLFPISKNAFLAHFEHLMRKYDEAKGKFYQEQEINFLSIAPFLS